MLSAEFLAAARELAERADEERGRLREDAAEASSRLAQDAARERAALAAERAAFREQRSRVASAQAHPRKVRLNVGGTPFTTGLGTLTRERGSMLEAMFSGRFACEPDAARAQAFAEHFSHTLGHRVGSLPC